MQNSTRSAVHEINRSKNSHMPIRFRYMHATKKTTNYRHDMTVFTFCHTILFRSLRTGKLVQDTFLVQLGTKNVRNILTTIIRTNSMDDSIVLSFDHL